MQIAEVALDATGGRLLDYSVPKELVDRVQIGSQVLVPLRSSQKKGIVVGLKGESQFGSLKPIQGVLAENPLLSQELFSLIQWVAHYYCTPLGEVLQLALPPGVRKGMGEKEQWWVTKAMSEAEITALCIRYRHPKPAQAHILETMLQVSRGIWMSELLEKTASSLKSVQALVKDGALRVEKRAIDRSPLVGEEYFRTQPKMLNQQQAAALADIEKALVAQTFQTHLLFGVTGSGKTEVYLQILEKAMQMGKGAIILVPEIALTQQTVERFKSRFSEKMAVLHSRLSEGERRDEWHHVQTGRAKIVIGARSSIFSPIQNLGLVIVDEEHDSSYKQQEKRPCYHARDVAVMRGKFAQALVLLGSATPSLESYHNTVVGKYHLNLLSVRADAASLPKVHIIDMRKEREKAKKRPLFSDTLLSAIEARHVRGEQTILFLNRRGYHTSLLCKSCGKSLHCQECSLPLTFYRQANRLSCHLCGFFLEPPPRLCPDCASAETLQFRGIGTEQVERALHAIFPSIRSVRVDADTTRHKGSLEQKLREFSSGKAELLIGTQMVAKGHHFPEVTLVGILDADAGLHIPDFRSAETTFQLIAQVAGRSGRGTLAGEVILQSFCPESDLIRQASQHDYLTFYLQETVTREMFGYPPFVQLIKFLLRGKEEIFVVQAAERLRSQIQQDLAKEVEIQPLIPCGHVKIQGEFRYQFLLKAKRLQTFCAYWAERKPNQLLPSSVKVFVDMNPTTTF